METFFNIRYEFDPQAVHGEIWQAVSQGKTGYICVADANILSLVHRNADYRRTVDEALLSICDSSWVPVFLRCLYGIRRPHYCGAQIFQDLVSSGHYRMAFLGGNAQVLHSLRAAIAPWNPAVAAMPFMELPFLPAEQFDYRAIAGELNASGVQIIWVALGAPKQEQFMQHLLPHLSHGVMIGVGAVFNFYSGHIRPRPRLAENPPPGIPLPHPQGTPQATLPLPRHHRLPPGHPARRKIPPNTNSLLNFPAHGRIPR